MWTYKSVLVGNALFEFLISWGKHFSFSFYYFYKEKFSFYLYFNPKSIKFCQVPLGLGPFENQALCVVILLLILNMNYVIKLNNVLCQMQPKEISMKNVINF